MKWDNLIFSQFPRQRFRRHSLFWTLWLIYFAGTFISIQQGHIQKGLPLWVFAVVIKSLLLILGHAFVTYMFIYFILPRYVLHRSHLAAAAILISSGAVCVAWSYFCYVVIFPVFDTAFQVEIGLAKNLILWNSITAGIISALKTMAVATAIKLLKQWYLKQKENERLEKEKIFAELQLLKAQIHPPVLFTTLDNIRAHALSDIPKASALLLRLSDLLSFMLYECEEPLIPLEKELKMLRDYVSLEKLRMGSLLEMGLSITEGTKNLAIAPLLLLPFVEHGFFKCHENNPENKWIDLDIRLEGNELSMKLINGRAIEEKNVTSSFENDLAAVCKRLALLYPERHSVREHVTPEMIMILLKIQLQENLPITIETKTPETHKIFTRYDAV